MLHIARNLLRRRALLLDRTGYRRGNLAHLIDRRGDTLDGAYGFAGRGLDRRNLSADLIGCLRGLFGETLDLGRYHGEPPACLAGARRFDRGIEREEVGLAGDFADQLDDIANARGVIKQSLNRRVGAVGFHHGFLCDRRRLCDLTADFGHRTGELLGRRRDGLYVC